jgi:hypothetical protein
MHDTHTGMSHLTCLRLQELCRELSVNRSPIQPMRSSPPSPRCLFPSYEIGFKDRESNSQASPHSSSNWTYSPNESEGRGNTTAYPSLPPLQDGMSTIRRLFFFYADPSVRELQHICTAGPRFCRVRRNV